MNFTHLHAFYAVASTGSISAGAERINVSQPAVTREIKALEQRLGSPLFDRLPRGVALTEAGQLLMRYAEQIFGAADAAELELKALRDVTVGHLDVSASATVGVYLVPRLLAAFYAQHPGITVNLTIGNSQTVQTAVGASQFGIGFIEGSYDATRFDALALGQDDIVAVRATAPPASPRGLVAADLARTLVILREQGSGVREAVDRAFAERGLVVAPRFCVSNTEAIKRLLQTMPGSLSFLSRLSVAEELAAATLEIVTVDDVTIERALHLVWRKGRGLSRAATLFKAMVEARQRLDAAAPETRVSAAPSPPHSFAP